MKRKIIPLVLCASLLLCSCSDHAATEGTDNRVSKSISISSHTSADEQTSTVSEIKRLGAQSIIILGGTGAVGEKVEGKLKEITSDVTRIEGSSRFETSVRIFFIICKP